MEVIDKKYIVRHSRTEFATFEWPYPGTPVSFEACDKFDERSEAVELLKECKKHGMNGHVCAVKYVIVSR